MLRGTKTKPPYGPAQAAFIKATREGVLAQGVAFFKGKDWTRLSPKKVGTNACLNSNTGSLLTDDTFYIKDIACWVPHLLIPDFIPMCPKCEKNNGVDTCNAKFVNRPKVLYGVDTHRYLDTVSYQCLLCESSFYGYNETSMKLASSKVTGIFNFYLSRQSVFTIIHVGWNWRRVWRMELYGKLSLLCTNSLNASSV